MSTPALPVLPSHGQAAGVTSVPVLWEPRSPPQDPGLGPGDACAEMGIRRGAGHPTC